MGVVKIMLSDLWNWLGDSTETLSQCQLKFKFLVLTFSMLLTLYSDELMANTSDPDKQSSIGEYAVYTLLVSVYYEWIYIFLSAFSLCWVRKQPNLFILSYVVNNISLIAVLFYIGIEYAFNYDDLKYHTATFVYGLGLLIVRTFAYICVYFFYLAVSPVLIYRYYKQIKLRMAYGDAIRGIIQPRSIRSRRANLLFAELGLSRGEIEALQDEILAESFLDSVDGRNRYTQDSLMATGDNEQSFSNLVYRVSYQSEKDNLDHSDCPICITPYSEDPDCDLIYLPCNRKHIFHASWILVWLKTKNEWPLWKHEISQRMIMVD